jgi:trk system potassium uptake protein TrkA
LLLEEGVESTDAFVALSGFDEENILLSLFAKDKGKGKLITKINRTDYDSVINRLDLDTVICPKNITADGIVRYVRAIQNTMGSNVEAMYDIGQGKAEVSEFIVKEGSPVCETPLSELKFKKNILIAAIARGNEVIIPGGQDVIKTGDSVVIVSKDMALLDIADVLR